MPYQPRSYPLVPMPQGPDPMQSLSGLMSLASNIEGYSAERKQRQQQQRIEQAFNKAKGDPIKAADILETTHGDFASGRTLRDKAGEIRRQTVDQIGQRIDSHKTILGQGGQLLTEAEANPTLWPELRSRVVDLASQLDPRLAAEIPEQYDQQKVRGMLQFVEGGVTDLGARSQAIAKLKAGYDATDDALKREKLYRESMAHWLSTTKTQEEWEGAKANGEAMGIPRSVIGEFGDWAPDAPARASEMLLTPEQKAVAARAKIDDDRADRTAKATADYRAAMLSIGRQREARLSQQDAGGATPTGRATAERWKASQLESLENEFAKPDTNLTIEDVRRRQLTIENSYRAQIGLPPLTALPAAWTGVAPDAARPPTAPPARAGGAGPSLGASQTQIVEQNGVRYEVTTDAAGKVIKAVPILP